MIDLSRHLFEVLHQDEKFTLHRGRREGDCSGVLVLSPVAEYAAPEILKWLEHAYSLREQLDSAWVARPLAITRHWDRQVLVLEDPGGMPLDGLLGEPLDIALWLRAAISLSATRRGFNPTPRTRVQFGHSAALQYSSTPSLRSVGFEDENESPCE